MQILLKLDILEKNSSNSLGFAKELHFLGSKSIARLFWQFHVSSAILLLPSKSIAER